jgi:hypothetical protein
MKNSHAPKRVFFHAPRNMSRPRAAPFNPHFSPDAYNAGSMCDAGREGDGGQTPPEVEPGVRSGSDPIYELGGEETGSILRSRRSATSLRKYTRSSRLRSVMGSDPFGAGASDPLRVRLGEKCWLSAAFAQNKMGRATKSVPFVFVLWRSGGVGIGKQGRRRRLLDFGVLHKDHV